MQWPQHLTSVHCASYNCKTSSSLNADRPHITAYWLPLSTNVTHSEVISIFHWHYIVVIRLCLYFVINKDVKMIVTATTIIIITNIIILQHVRNSNIPSKLNIFCVTSSYQNGKLCSSCYYICYYKQLCLLYHAWLKLKPHYMDKWTWQTWQIFITLSKT